MKDGNPGSTSQRSPKLTGELFPYKGNSFVVKWRDRSMDADAFVIFGLDEQGKAATMTMKAISPLTDFSYDFQDLAFRRLELRQYATPLSGNVGAVAAGERRDLATDARRGLARRLSQRADLALLARRGLLRRGGAWRAMPSIDGVGRYFPLTIFSGGGRGGAAAARTGAQ